MLYHYFGNKEDLFRITLEDAYKGKETSVSIQVSARCDPCGGSGAKPGTSANACGTCGGHGQVRTQQGEVVALVDLTDPTQAINGIFIV